DAVVVAHGDAHDADAEAERGDLHGDARGIGDRAQDRREQLARADLAHPAIAQRARDIAFDREPDARGRRRERGEIAGGPRCFDRGDLDVAIAHAPSSPDPEDRSASEPASEPAGEPASSTTRMSGSAYVRSATSVPPIPRLTISVRPAPTSW